jgi:hypothetical protein
MPFALVSIFGICFEATYLVLVVGVIDSTGRRYAADWLGMPLLFLIWHTSDISNLDIFHAWNNTIDKP